MKEFLNSRARLTSPDGVVVDAWIHEINDHQIIIRLKPGSPTYVGSKFTFEAHGTEFTILGTVKASYQTGVLMTVLRMGDWQYLLPAQQDQRRAIPGLFAQWPEFGAGVQTPLLDAGQHGFGALLPIALELGTQTEVEISFQGLRFVATVEVLHSHACEQTHFGRQTGFKFVEFKVGSPEEWVLGVLQSSKKAA